MTVWSNQKPNVLVVSGGPASSKAATPLARSGWHLTLLEARQLRFRIGESPILKQLLQAPRTIFQVEQAVILMLAGDVFENRPAFGRQRLSRTIDAAAALKIRFAKPSLGSSVVGSAPSMQVSG